MAPLPPVRKRSSYADINAGDLTFALFYDRILDSLGPIGVEAEYKHGKHDQSSHGRRGGGARSAGAAYTAVRQAGGTVQEARQARRDVMEINRNQQRIANIDRQRQGEISAKQDASLRAERDRLIEDNSRRAKRIPDAATEQANEAYNANPEPTVRGRMGALHDYDQTLSVATARRNETQNALEAAKRDLQWREQAVQNAAGASTSIQRMYARERAEAKREVTRLEKELRGYDKNVRDAERKYEAELARPELRQRRADIYGERARLDAYRQGQSTDAANQARDRARADVLGTSTQSRSGQQLSMEANDAQIRMRNIQGEITEARARAQNARESGEREMYQRREADARARYDEANKQLANIRKTTIATGPNQYTPIEQLSPADASRRLRINRQAIAAYGNSPKTRDEVAILRAQNAELEKVVKGAQTVKDFTVYKDASGAQRWIARTTTAYRDRDGEILATDALDQDSARMTAAKSFGPLRWWHVGAPDPTNAAAPWGPGLDLGTCDFSTVIGRTRIESGTFKSAAIARAVATIAPELELSPGFFHAPTDPDADGVYHTIRTFERSLVPTKYGRASNYFTGFTVKEIKPMNQQEMARRFKAMAESLGLGADEIATLAGDLARSEKAADARGIAFKSSDAPHVYTAPDGTLGIIQDGAFVALKAAADDTTAAAEVEVETESDAAEGDEEQADAGDLGELYVGDMTPDEFGQVLKAAFDQSFAPILKAMDMAGKMGSFVDEIKSMTATTQTKEAGNAAEIAALKAEIAELKGYAPAAQSDVFAALKSGGPQAPPQPQDPNTPQVPNDPNRPYASLAAMVMPELYQP